MDPMYQSTSNVEELLMLDEKYRSYLEKKIAMDPANIPALIHLGVLCWEPFHEQKKAIEYLEKAIKLDTRNVDSRFWLAKCYYHDYCAYEKTRQILQEALEIDPNRSDCLSLLASVIMDTTKDLNETIDYLKKAIKLAPDWPSLRFFLSFIYLKVKKIELAEEQAQKIKEIANNLHHKNPCNGIEFYYETIVTGRNDQTIFEDLEKLNEKIRQSKIKNL